MVRAIDIKHHVDPPLNEIKGIKNKALKRSEIVSRVWDHIKKKKLQGVSGDTCKYTSKKTGKKGTAKGGQVIFVGDDPILKAVCANKKKIAMFELPVYMEKYLERAD
jgi:chromatin remodeling complex protein RSC6